MSSFSTSIISDDQILEPLKTSSSAPNLKRARREGSFKVSLLPKGHKKVDPKLLQELNTMKDNIALDGKHPISMVFVNINEKTPTANKKIEEEDVSPEFINDFNRHIGNNHNKEKAQRLIEKMQHLGGLIPTLEEEEIDIPAARLGLSYLASLNNPKFKMEALDNLLMLLQNDTLEKKHPFTSSPWQSV